MFEVTTTANQIGHRKPEILQRLNEQQKLVVTTVDGPTLVVAGAGSGKTTVLTRRVAYLIDVGIRPESILLLTFTRAASHSMLSRARALAPEARNVIGGTFHSFATHLIREAFSAFGIPQNFTVLDPEDSIDAIKACIGTVKYECSANKPQAKSVANIISFASNTKSTIEHAIEVKSRDWSHASSWIQSVRDQYVLYKLDRGLLDYDDLLIYLKHLLENDELGPQIRSRYKYIMVDEHQDSNALQLDIVYGLGEHFPNIMAVGDPAQSIYGFRGSAPAVMFDFTKHWPGAKVLNLEVNYRSTQQILNLVNAVDRSMSTRFDRELRSSNTGTFIKPYIVTCRDQRHEAEEVCARILRSKDEGHALSEHAVLFRSAFIVRRLETELISRKIPYCFRGGLRIDEAAHVKDILSILRIADNVRHEPAWMRILQRLPKIGIESAKVIISHVFQADNIHDAIKLLVTSPKPRHADLQPLIDALGKVVGQGSIGSRLWSAVNVFEGVLKKEYGDTWGDRKRDLEMIVDISEDYQTITDFLSAVTLDYSLDKRRRDTPHLKNDEEPITLSTIHSAKGLEWKFVHIPSFTNGHLPSMYAITTEELDEEARIFYVATSRAMEELVFYKPRTSEKGELKQDSSFEEVIQDYIEQEAAITSGTESLAPLVVSNQIDMRSRLLGNRTQSIPNAATSSISDQGSVPLLSNETRILVAEQQDEEVRHVTDVHERIIAFFKENWRGTPHIMSSKSDFEYKRVPIGEPWIEMRIRAV